MKKLVLIFFIINPFYFATFAQQLDTFGFGQLNDGEFGKGFGSDSNPQGYSFLLNIKSVVNSTTNVETGSCNTIYKISYKIYDIDYDGEVRLYINDIYTAYITATGDKQLKSRKVEFCGSLFNDGNNRIEFRVPDSDRVWGVKDIRIQYITIGSVDLALNKTQAMGYGNGFGTDSHPDYLVVGLGQLTGLDHAFSVTSWDVDNSNEVSVYLNDVLLGSLTQICNRCQSASQQFFLDQSLLNNTSSQLLFKQNRSSEPWGVTDLTLSIKASMVPIFKILLLDE